MNINVGDNIVAKKSTWIADEGKVGNVTEVTDNSISFVFEGNPKVSCKMDFDTFNEYFAKVEVEEKTAVEIPAITFEYIEAIMEHSEIEVHSVSDKCTVVSCKLPNGFIIVESYTFANYEDYDEEIGVDICLGKIEDKIFELETYRLQEEVYRDMMAECPFSCNDCDECPCDGSGCEESFEEDDEVDCAHCDDYKCPHNTNDSLFNTGSYSK